MLGNQKVVASATDSHMTIRPGRQPAQLIIAQMHFTCESKMQYK